MNLLAHLEPLGAGGGDLRRRFVPDIWPMPAATSKAVTGTLSPAGGEHCAPILVSLVHDAPAGRSVVAERASLRQVARGCSVSMR